MITLARTMPAAVATLPDRLLWTDEYAWTPVVTETRWGTAGALQVHVGKRQAGRPIALDGRASNAWINRTLCDQLNDWAAQSGEAFALQLRGAVRSVLFLEFQADPLWRVVDGEHTPELLYLPTFKFLEI